MVRMNRSTVEAVGQQGNRTVTWSRGALAATILWSVWQTSSADILPSVRSRADVRTFPRGPEVPDDAALEASGAIVGTVRHVRLNVFDPTIPAEDTALFRIANRIHIVSRESTLGAQLLFRSGERYEGRLLEESERVLRSKPYLGDAHIRPVNYRDGLVDIEVITQDTWTLRPELNYSRKGGETSSGIGIEEDNLFGTGARLGLKYKSGVERDSKVLLYTDSNVGGSRWRVDAQYEVNSDGGVKKFVLDRPFYALDTRWASGIYLRDERRTDSVYEGGQVIDQFATHERYGTVYVGGSRGLRDGWVMRWTTGVTVDERHATALPATLPGSSLPKDRDLVYPWVGVEWVEDDFRVARNLDQIARTEDVKLGWQGGLRLGLSATALGSDRNALVFDGKVTKGFQPDQRQTLLLSGGATGRVEQGQLTDTVFSAAARYYWRHSTRRSLFVGLSADHGVRLDVDSQLTLGGDNGLRGYPYKFQTGQNRWLFTAEERWFTDWYPFRLFHVGGAVFYDMGQASGGNLVETSAPVPSDSKGVLRDVGVGLRLGMSRSSVGTVLHIDMAYPFDREASMRKVQVNVELKRSF